MNTEINSFPSHLAHRAALISNSVALIQTPAEPARPWTRGQCVARCACLLPSLCLPNYSEAVYVNNFSTVMLNWTRILQLQFRSSNQYATELREYIAINSIITSWYWPDQTVLITRTFYIVLDGHNRRLAVENSRRPIVPTLWRRQWNFSTFEVILQLQWPLDESCGVWQLHLYEAPRQFHLIITFMGFAKYLRD